MHQEIRGLLNHPDFQENQQWWRSHYAPNDTILHVGESANNLLILSDGLARVTGYVDVDGKKEFKMGINDLGAGDLFGELTLLNHGPRCASVVAIEPCEIVEIDGDQLIRFLDENPEIGYRVMRLLMETISQRLRSTTSKVFTLFGWGLRAHEIDKYL